MNTAAENRVREHLLALADPAYRDFQAALIPNIEKARILGVRMPILRKFAKEYAKTEDANAFLTALPHETYDEMNLHGLLLETIRDIDALEQDLDRFLPHVDNWATCDLLSLKLLKRYPERRMALARAYIDSDHAYTIRFGIGILMRYELDATFTPDILALAAAPTHEDYYVKMMQAWFFATALAKQHEATLPYLTEHKLPLWIHNKTIRKAIESDRITPEQKKFLRTLSRKS